MISKIELYHYTSYDALISILTNQEIWLGDLWHMNDCEEHLYYIKNLRKRVLRLSKNQKQKALIENEFHEFFEYINKYYTFAISFSLLKNDVSQWERYADKGKGVCIIFNREILESLKYLQLRLQKIFYKHENFSSEHIVNYMKIINNCSPRDFGTFKEWKENVFATASAYKHPSFSSEQEVRILTLPISKQKESQEREAELFGYSQFARIEMGLKKKCFKINYKKLMNIAQEMDFHRKYYNFRIGGFQDLIKGIIIGPCATKSMEEVVKELSDLGIKNIEKSNCPLRVEK